MLGNIFAAWLYEQVFGKGHTPTMQSGGSTSGGSTQAGGGATGSTLPATGKSGCRPPLMTVTGPNPDWFVFTGVELALIVLMLIGILAVLFGNKETDETVLKVAEVAAA